MQKVLVVAVASNTTNRFLFETGFIGALNQKGIDATASFTTLGDALPTKEALAVCALKSGTARRTRSARASIETAAPTAVKSGAAVCGARDATAFDVRAAAAAVRAGATVLWALYAGVLLIFSEVEPGEKQQRQSVGWRDVQGSQDA